MKYIKYLLLILICVFCISCTPDDDSPSKASDIISDDLPYEEVADSLEGVDELDLSGLINAVNAVGSNYATKTNVFLNRLAVNRVNVIYKTNYYCKQFALYDTDYVYRYSSDFYINEATLMYNSHLYLAGLEGETLGEKLDSTLSLDNLTIVEDETKTSIKDYYFTLDDLNEEYINTYGYTEVPRKNKDPKIYYGWTRISENKYKCDRLEVIEDFMHICMPAFSNEGTYLTFSHVTVEVNPDAEHALRLRLYTSPTQTGKLISSHLDEENKPNWYLLIAETYIYEVGNVNVSAIKNLINNVE